MNIFTDDSLKYYRLGEFIAHNMLNGIVHPDMQFDNIEIRANGQFAYIDYANIITINMPSCLSADICEQLTLALVPIIESIKDSFSKMSSFRMGFIALGGLLGYAIFSNTKNWGVSSSWYTKCNFSTSSYDSSFLYADLKSKVQIRNWKKQSFDQITPIKYHALDEYERSKERSNTPEANRHFLDILYYSRGYAHWGAFLQEILPKEGSPELYNPVLAYNVYSADLSCNYYIERLAETALRNKHYYTAYGLFNKCLSSTHIVDEIEKTSQDGLSYISKSTHRISSVCDWIMENLDHDLFELMWILEELDQNSKI